MQDWAMKAHTFLHRDSLEPAEATRLGLDLESAAPSYLLSCIAKMQAGFHETHPHL